MADHPQQSCGLAQTLEVVGERWTLLLVRDALRGVSRFSDFRARLGIAPNILALRLELLVAHEVMTKVPYQDRPVRYDYLLTPKGTGLMPALQALTAWGETYAPRV
jgi:DNA-binding HxlR family transcriptional regulator